jgi:hypothetical protein
MYSAITQLKLINDTAYNTRTGILQITTEKRKAYRISPFQNFQACYEIVRAVLPDKLDQSNAPALSPQEIVTIANDQNQATGLPLNAVPATADIPNTGDAARTLNEKSVKNVSFWFYMIAGLSVLNALIYLAGMKWNFLIGLGATDFLAGFSKAAGGTLGAIGVILTFLIAGVFVFFGIYARKQKPWAFVAGLIIYTLDALIFIWVSDWLSVAFHAFVWFVIFTGAKACFKLQPAKQSMSTEKTF